jgi:C-terminal processing protease CtpA/Prc
MVQMRSFLSIVLTATLFLSGCGGGGGGGGTTAVVPTPSPTPTPSQSCSLRDRQLWAEQQIREWYLFPDDLPANLDPEPYSTVNAYIDALTATARAQNKDRFTTYVTSITQENAYNASGQTAAFGIRLGYDSANRTVTILDSYETGPAFSAGLTRGVRITAVGDRPDSLVSVSDLFVRGGSAAVSEALGPSTVGVSRAIRYQPVVGPETTVTVTKAEFNIPPVSPTFGTQIIISGGQSIGYINLRTFIASAETPLREAFQRFRTAGVDRVVIDFRYNGGGLVSVAELMGDLMGRSRLSSDLFSRISFRPSKSSENSTHLFRDAPQSIAPRALAFITTGSTASASELVAAGMMPWTRGNIAMVGENSYGKPVGQIAIDRTACDDRLRVIAFAVQNADGDGDYYTGLKSVFDRRGEKTCMAQDTPSLAMGNPAEGQTAAALSVLNGATCTPISGSAGLISMAQDTDVPITGAVHFTGRMLPSSFPTPAQRDMPGLY